MFVGHHAIAFAAKPLAPRVSLGTLFAATVLLDLIWPVLVPWDAWIDRHRSSANRQPSTTNHQPHSLMSGELVV